MAPSLERELRVDLTTRAQEDAIKVFAKNTEGLLQQRPVRGARVIALDPGYRAGCKVAVLDEYGKLLGVNSLRTLVLYNADRLMGDIMYDDIISCLPSEEEEDVAADIFKYDIPAMPVVDEHGTLLGIVTTDDAWDAIEDDVAGDKTKMNVLSIAGITVASLMGLFLYSLILLQLAGSLHLGGLHY